MIAAIDLGTGSCKVIVFNPDGTEVERATSSYENAVLEGGRAEQMPERWEGAVKELLQTIDSDIDAIAVTGLGRGITFLGKDRKPVRNSILAYMDSRTEEVDTELPGLNWGQRQLFENLQWVRQSQGDVFGEVEHAVDARDYIGYLLTGELRRNDFGVTGEVEEAGKELGFDQLLPPLNDSMTPLGTLSREMRQLTGLDEIPVYVAPWDAICSVLGSGIKQEGEGMVICGSTTVTAVCLPEEDERANKSHLVDGKGFYLGAEPAGSAYEWFRQNMAEDYTYEEIDSMIEETKPAEGPLTLPFFKGNRLDSLPGTITGIENGTSIAEIARSVIEAEAYFLREEFEEFEIKEVRISGGGAKSHVRNRIRADVVGEEFKRLETDDTSALGAAMIASAAEGVHENLTEAIAEMTSVKETFQPEDENSYETAYQRYRKLEEALEDV
ncbi:MAG: FGGY-family carbohydrate kinase [Candidatus Nanohaloarchaea archaeon]